MNVKVKYVSMDKMIEGNIYLEDGIIKVKPEGNVLLNNIISEPIFTDEGKVKPSEPEKFLKNLYKKSSSYCWIYEAEGE